MTWQTLPTYSTYDIPTEEELLKFYSNLEVLRNGNSQTRTLMPSTTNISKSGSTWADISSNLNITMTTYGGNILLTFLSNIGCSADTESGVIDFSIDGTRLNGSTGVIHIQGVSRRVVAFAYPIIGLSAGSHTFNPQWSAILGTFLLFGKNLTSFSIREY